MVQISYFNMIQTMSPFKTTDFSSFLYHLLPHNLQCFTLAPLYNDLELYFKLQFFAHCTFKEGGRFAISKKLHDCFLECFSNWIVNCLLHIFLRYVVSDKCEKHAL